MVVVETIAKIRRAYFVQGKALKAISRELKISRKVVRKVIRSGATKFAYERTVQPQPKLGPWREVLEQRLATNAARSSRERLTLSRIFEELRGLGYAGGYDAVRRHAARWRREHSSATAAAFVPLSFASGEAYQFDWSHEIVVINGTTVAVKVAHMRLCHSRMPFVRAYPRESHEPPRSPVRGPFGSGLEHLADARGSLTPTSGRSLSSRAPARAASTTT